MFSTAHLVNSYRKISTVLTGVFMFTFLLGLNVNAASPVCGDGITQAPEQCDDGNLISGDGCSEKCMIEPICGNNIAEPGEECDQGLPVNGTKCSSCRFVISPQCNDGILDLQENCEPSTHPNSCNGDCTYRVCGDHKIGPGEECDSGGMTSTCNSNCKISRCGDAILNTQSGEQCDPGLITGSCNWNCRFNTCGDSILNKLAGEECDPPGNMTSGDTCSPLCKIIFAPTMAPGAGGLDTGTIIGIAVGAASLIAATIPLVLVFRKWRKTHDFCGLPATGNVAVNIPMNPNPTFQAPKKPLPTPGI